MKMIDFGFAEALPENRNEISINILEGTMKLVDCCGMEFSLTKDFQTNIVKPETLYYPEYAYGATAIRTSLKKSSKIPIFGNCPSLFAISANGEENYELKRDCDLANLFKLNYDNVIEETGPYEESVQLSLTKSIKIPGLDRNVVIYSQVRLVLT